MGICSLNNNNQKIKENIGRSQILNNINSSTFSSKSNTQKFKEIIRGKQIFNNIKSSYILKKIFSLLEEKKKLKTIMYNKKLQKNIDISLANYKFYNLSFVKDKDIYDEYTSYLVYRGEFLKGRRNGKGKWYRCDLGTLDYGHYFCNLKIDSKWVK